MIKKRFSASLSENCVDGYLRGLGFAVRQVRDRPRSYDVSYPHIVQGLCGG